MVYLGASLWLICSLFLIWRLRIEVSGTTLIDAWRWSMGGCCLWAVGWCCEFIPGVAAGVRDQIWYAVALMILAALVSVLGAKRPGSRVWTCFVTLPMLLCLSWPALFSWLKGWPPAPIRLMAPALLAYAVVCVMGLGNYVGTRFLWSACWMGLALAWLVMPYSGWVPDIMPTPTGCRMRATLCAGFAVIWPVLLGSNRQAFLAPWDRVWVDFVNMFGIAWGRRLQDRFNDTARRAKWGVKLDFYGLAWDDAQRAQDGESPQVTFISDSTPLPMPTGSKPIETAQILPTVARDTSTQKSTQIPPKWTPEMIAALQWLLRRFVDEKWIARRTHQNQF